MVKTLVVNKELLVIPRTFRWIFEDVKEVDLKRVSRKEDEITLIFTVSKKYKT